MRKRPTVGLALALIAMSAMSAEHRPLGLDLYRPVPEDNPITAEKVKLGRQLFRERLLSRDGSIACAGCHQPKLAFTNGRAKAVRVYDRQGPRSVPTLINRAWGESFFWDGRMPTLEEQVVQPILAETEMDLTLEEAVKRLNEKRRYRKAFAEAFGRAPNAADLAAALASYVRTIMSGDSPYDRYLFGDSRALSVQQLAGLRIFRGKANCALCHTGPILSDEEFHNTGVAWRDGALVDDGRAFPAALAAQAPAERPPNIVLFLVDDLGWMDLGCQGSSFYETPRIDALARQGMRFTNAYSACPVCSPSRAALMTGKYPGSVGFTGHITAILRHRYKKHGRIIPPDDYMFLRHRETTLAEALKPAGYVSASIGKWHLGSEQYWPERHGFDLNVAGYDHGSPPSHFYPYTKPGQDWNSRIPTLAGGAPGEYLTDRLTDEAVHFIDSNRDQPFFLYLTHYAVHTPLEAPDELIRKYEQKLKHDDAQFSPVYAAMIESIDQSLGRILDTLERHSLDQNTVVIFTSDNGGTQVATRNTPLREGKGYLYEGGIRVPLIISQPGRTTPGSTSATPVTGADLYPTITEIAGKQAAPGETDGRSLTPLLAGRQDAPARDLYWYYPHYSPQAKQPGAAIRSGKYKLIEHYDPPSVELYDIETDISEQINLAEREPARAAALLERLRGWVQTNVPIRHKLNPSYDPDLALNEAPE